MASRASQARGKEYKTQDFKAYMRASILNVKACGWETNATRRETRTQVSGHAPWRYERCGRCRTWAVARMLAEAWLGASSEASTTTTAARRRLPLRRRHDVLGGAGATCAPARGLRVAGCAGAAAEDAARVAGQGGGGDRVVLTFYLKKKLKNMKILNRPKKKYFAEI